MASSKIPHGATREELQRQLEEQVRLLKSLHEEVKDKVKIISDLAERSRKLQGNVKLYSDINLSMKEHLIHLEKVTIFSAFGCEETLGKYLAQNHTSVREDQLRFSNLQLEEKLSASAQKIKEFEADLGSQDRQIDFLHTVIDRLKLENSTLQEGAMEKDRVERECRSLREQLEQIQRQANKQLPSGISGGVNNISQQDVQSDGEVPKSRPFAKSKLRGKDGELIPDPPGSATDCPHEAAAECKNKDCKFLHQDQKLVYSSLIPHLGTSTKKN